MPSPDMMGVARKVTIDKESTTIVAGGETKADVQKGLVKSSSQKIPTLTTTKKKLQERIAKLAGGVAVISGWCTETELKDRKLRIEDALNATKAAVEEGIVPGGGTTLIHLTKKINEIKKQPGQRRIELIL